MSHRPSWRLRAAGLAAVAAIVLGFGVSCRAGPASYMVVSAPPKPADARLAVVVAGSGDSVVNARFRNVHFHMWPGVALQLDDLAGRMHSTRRDAVVTFDDK